MRSGRPFSIFLLAALLMGYGCSSSQTTGDDPFIDIAGLESGADEVGSIPEDALVEPAYADITSPAADPFADLEENDTDPLALSSAGDYDTLSSDSGSRGTGGRARYEVRPGDTLMKIAFSIYGDIDRWKDLLDMNRSQLKSANQLRVGMQLTYEPPARPFSQSQLANSYVIKQGDTLAGIADEVYGRRMKYRKLQQYNSRLIRDPNRIFAGFTIFYDITPQEMAEAEERRMQRMSGGGGGNRQGAARPAPQAQQPQSYNNNQGQWNNQSQQHGGYQHDDDEFNMIPSAVSPAPVQAAPPARDPIAVAPPPPGHVVPAPNFSGQ